LSLSEGFIITELRQRRRHSEKYPPSVSYVGRSLYCHDEFVQEFVWRCRTHGPGAIVVSIWKIVAFGGKILGKIKGKIVVTREAAIVTCLLAFRTRF
jgi:hypothetical protein